jgi:hypothetical protein
MRLMKHIRKYTMAMGLALALPAAVQETQAAEETNYARNSTVIAWPAGGWELEGLRNMVDGKKGRNDPKWGTYSPCEVELWFPYDQPVPVTKIRIAIGPEPWAPPQQYRGEVQSWDGGQWVTVREFDSIGAWDKPMEWDGLDLKTKGLRLVIHDSTWRGGGGGGGGDVMFHEVEAFGPASEAQPLDAAARLRVEPQGLRDAEIPSADRRVFKLGEPAVVKVSLDGAGLPAGDYELRCDIRDWQLNKIETLSAQPAKTGAGTEATFRWKSKEQGPFLVDVSLWKDGALAGFAREKIGVRDDKLFETGQIEPLPAPAGLKRKSYDDLVGPGNMLFSVGEPGHVNMPAYERNAREEKAAGYDCIKAWQGWRSLEPLPGVYSFQRIDDIFRHAVAHDLGVGVWFGHHDQEGSTPVWLRDEVQRYHHGRRDSVVPGRYYGSMHIANHGEKARAHRPALARLLAARYGKHPALVSWMPNQISIEAGLNEQPEYRLDYSRWAMLEFREFLKEYKGWPLEEVAARWGMHLNHWDEVHPPRPYFELTGDIVNAYVIDTRPIWLDWKEYQEWGQTRAIADGVEPLRAASPDVPMSLWSDMGFGEAHYLPYLRDKRVSVAFCAMGSGSGSQIMKHAMFARRWGVPYRNEYHSLAPPSIGHWNGGIYDQLAMEARMFDWIGATPRSPKPVMSWVPAFYTTARVKEMLDELSWAKRPMGEVGYLWSMLATQLQGKGANWSVDVETWTRMMAVGQYAQTRHRWVEPFVWGGPLEDLAHTKAVYADEARVIPAADAEKVAEYVRNGGRLVMTWVTGQFERPPTGPDTSPEVKAELTRLRGVFYQHLVPTYPLLKALGYREPDRLHEVKQEEGGGGVWFAPGAVEGGPARHGTLKVTAEHPALAGLDNTPLQFCVPLDPQAVPEGKVLATNDGQPVAISWKLGQGEVVLLGGMLGDIPMEDSWLKRAGLLGKERSQEVGEAVKKGFDGMRGTVATLLGNLHAWTGSTPDLVGPEDVLGHYGRNGDTHYAMLMNHTGQQWKDELKKTGTVWKFPSLPDGDYDVTLMRIAGDESLGARGAAELREKGLTLDFGPQEFIAIRLKPVRPTLGARR